MPSGDREFKSFGRAVESALPEIPEDTHPDVEESWEFWKELICHPDGSINIKALKNELHDMLMLMEFYPKVLMHITGGRISKPSTLPSVVCQVADEHYRAMYEEEKDGE